MKKKSFSSVKNVACLLVCVLWFVIVLCWWWHSRGSSWYVLLSAVWPARIVSFL
jgi:hypothetical protein